MKARRRWLAVGLFATLSITSTVAIYLVGGTSIENVRLALRTTARISLVLFLLTFVASSYNRLFGGRVGKWLLRNRRYLGVSFGVAHLVHLGTIGARVALHTSGFWEERTVGSLVPGAIVYTLIVLMMVTSSDRATRWLGRKKWKVLHKIGVYAVFAVFAASYAQRGLDSVEVIVPLTLLVLALTMRGLARIQILRKRSQRGG